MTITTGTAQKALFRLGHFIAKARPQPDATTLQTLRDGVFDVLGCILVGASTDIAQRARAAVRQMGSGLGSPVFGTDMDTSRSHAALLNATAGHALDFDDWEIPGNSHPSVVMIPALLAAADRHTSGRDLVTPYLVGFETIARLGEAMNFEHYDKGWHTTATLAALGATAAVSRLRALDPAQTTHALSLAVSRASGYTCQFGSNAKPLQAGFAAQTGVECALLAQAGLTGQAHVLEHTKGLMALTAGTSPTELTRALDRLGSPLALSQYGLVLKPWPSCGYTHRIMTCALQLAPELGDLGDIDRIDLHLPDFHAAILPFHTPTNRSEALFSLPFVCAMGLLRRRLSLRDVSHPTWDEPAIVSLITKTEIHPFSPVKPDLNYAPEDPDKLSITLRSGRVLSATCTYPLGAPQNPMAPSQIRSKFASNAGPVPEGWIDAMFDWPNSPSILSLLDIKGSQR